MNWRVVYQRYEYWCKKGNFERLFQGVQEPVLKIVFMLNTRLFILPPGRGDSHTKRK